MSLLSDSVFLTPAPPPSSSSAAMDAMAMGQLDRLGMEETRDLVISALFVLKHVDSGEGVCVCEGVIECVCEAV